MKPVIIHSQARAELDEAIAFYEHQKAGLGLDLQTAVARAIGRIQQNPQLGALYKATEFRHYVVRRFPHIIFYAELEEAIWIVAIAHGKRREDRMGLTLSDLAEPFAVPDTMRAAVLFGPRDIRLIDRPVPKPDVGEVLVKVAMCGTCGTDLKIYDGHFPLTPPFGAFTPGHEWTGTVVALGETVDEFAVGDRVCIEAHHGCGRCDNCLIGRYTACLNYGNPTKGHRATGMTADGGFAEYVLHHVSSLYKMPVQVSFKDAVLLTTAGTGLYGLDAVGGYIAGEDIAIFGPGPVGLMTVQACKQLGAARVILVGTRTSRLEMGRRLGADHVINIREQDPVTAIGELTGGVGVDLAIECSGAVETPQQCVQVTKRGGKILVVAFYDRPVTLDLSAVVRSDITIYTTRGEGGNNVKRAVSLAAQGRMRGTDLVTHEFPLEEIAEAFRVMRERIGDPIKIVIIPEHAPAGNR